MAGDESMTMRSKPVTSFRRRDNNVSRCTVPANCVSSENAVGVAVITPSPGRSSVVTMTSVALAVPSIKSLMVSGVDSPSM